MGISYYEFRKIGLLKSSPVTGKFISHLKICVDALSQVTDNWFARKKNARLNQRAKEALDDYIQVKKLYDNMEVAGVNDALVEIANQLGRQSKDSILKLLAHNQLVEKEENLKSIKRLKKIFPKLPEPDELIEILRGKSVVF